MSSLVIHPASALQLERIVATKPHALLLSGPEGVGLLTIARSVASDIAAEVTAVLPERDDVVDVEKGTITVDSIRRLYHQTRTKSSGRTIIIDYAERMGTSAQNAFLKLLEEPTESTHFILLSHTPDTLLPTIHSRVQHIAMQSVTRAQSEALLNDLYVSEPAKRAQLLFIAEGLPATLIRLQDESVFAARTAIVRDARTFITGSPYERLLIGQQYKDRRSDALTLLEDAMKQLRMTAVAKKDAAVLPSLEKLLEVYETVNQNGNIRLHLGTVL